MTAAILASHIATGTGSVPLFDVPGPKSTSTTPRQPCDYHQRRPVQPESGKPDRALAALAKNMTAQPQYLVLPTAALKNAKGINGQPQDFTGPAGYGPAQVAGAYGFNQTTFSNGVVGNGQGQTIAVVDAGDYTGFVNSTDPNFSSSALAVFDSQFGLPDPPSFTKYNEFGQTSPLPSPVPGWGLEITLDVEWAHAMAPAANIILVEGSNSNFGNLGRAANTAATLLGASVVSQSFGGALEAGGYGYYEQILDDTYYSPALAANPNVTFLAATGDAGGGSPIYPSVSPLTVAVGGTNLFINGDTWAGETAWYGGGGGVSNFYSEPTWQQGVQSTGFRTVPDISATSSGQNYVSVYDPVDYGGWVGVEGTSVATPITGASIAIADQGRVSLGGQALNGPNQTLPGLYALDNSGTNYVPPGNDTGGGSYFRDIVAGSNGFPAIPGYDYASGIGSELAPNLLPGLSLYELGPAVIGSDPFSGEVLVATTPTTFSLTFNEPIVLELDRGRRLHRQWRSGRFRVAKS